MATSAAPRSRHSDSVIPLELGWQAAPSPPDQRTTPDELGGLTWLPAHVPGTVAEVLREAGRAPGNLDAEEWWFRTSFEAEPTGDDEELVLHLDGLATVAEVFLNGKLVLSSESMFAGHTVDISRAARGRNELAIRFRALAPLLATPRRPRARWRTRLVPDNGLRWYRTMLLGRIPSFAPGPAAVGPWRPIWLRRRSGLLVDDVRLRTRLDGQTGVLAVEARLRALAGDLPSAATVEIDGPSGRHDAALTLEPDGAGLIARGTVRVPAVAQWWPHTHGDPALHDVTLVVGEGAGATSIRAGRVGFRSVAAGPTADHDIDRDGLSLHINGASVFARGGLWTPLDIVSLRASREELHGALERFRDAGMNMVRVPGFGPYEQAAFHELCDELGILVWQDLSFASMDYPFDDPEFGRACETEVRGLAARLAARPSTAVVCGNSEVEQQVAMLGLDMSLARIPFYDESAPRLMAETGLDAVYVPSSPFGGDLPMRADRGVTNYYGVGGYRQPLSDARTSGLRFAGESLAFANIPDDEALATLVPEPPFEPFMHHPRWKAGVARDAGSGWDFDDLRDHYLGVVYGVDPIELRRDDTARYLELSRVVTGEVMANAYGEWRRAESPCAGALILWWRDLVPGAGYGIVDNRGRPKTPWFALRRALAPAAVWLVDERTGGVIAHIANDGPEPLRTRLRVRLYSDQELEVGGGEVALEVPAHGAVHHDVEAVVGHFVDAAWAFRFGPPAQDVIVASLERDDPAATELLSQAFHFPAGWPLNQEPARRLGLVAELDDAGGLLRLAVSSRRLAYAVRIHVPGFTPSDDAFSVEPGGTRTIELRPDRDDSRFDGGWLTGLNLAGQVPVTQPGGHA